MVELIFKYNGIETLIKANLDDSFNTIVQKYINETKLDINNIYFIYNDKKISNDEQILDIMNESEKINKRKIILVLSVNNIINNDNTNMIKSKDIICPTCKEPCIYEIKDYKIKLYGCKNGHITENIKLDDFNKKQNIDISPIICDKCKIIQN